MTRRGSGDLACQLRPHRPSSLVPPPAAMSLASYDLPIRLAGAFAEITNTGMGLTLVRLRHLVRAMENKPVLGPKGATRRAFLSASAVTAAAAPMLTRAAPASAAAAGTGSAVPGREFDPELRAMLREVDPGRIRAIIQRLTQFGRASCR